MFADVDKILKHCAPVADNSPGNILDKYKVLKECAMKEAEKEDLNFMEKWELEAKLDHYEARALQSLDRTNAAAAYAARVDRMRRKNPELGAAYDGTLETIDKYEKGDIKGAAAAAAITAIRSTKQGQIVETVKDTIEDPSSILDHAGSRKRKPHKKKTKDPKKSDKHDSKENVQVKRNKKCDKLIMEINCKGYPRNRTPLFHLPKSPEVLDISDLRRCQRNKSGDPLLAEFKDAYKNKPITGDTRRFLIERFEVSDAALDAGGKQVLSELDTMGVKYNMHHLLPGWAGGTDIGTNLAPISNPKIPGLSGDHLAVHNWWSEKTKQQRDKLMTQAKKCDKEDKAKHKKDKKYKAKDREKCLRNKSMTLKALAECQLTKVAECLKKEEVQFQLKITCPSATR